MTTGRTPRRIGLAIVGAGRIGLIRGEIAARHGNVDWIGIAETRADRGKEVATRIGADFVTTDHRELLAVVGYTQRFRRRFLTAKEKIRTEALDLSARRKRPVPLPITPEDERV
jgi:predicted dehydrogenase